ncbi:MAG: 3'(2'),5'-bisphosphate nucleotidase CysQ [Pseudomonadota bacterium]
MSTDPEPDRLGEAQLRQWIPTLLDACQHAADAILDIYQQPDLGIQQKQDLSPLTLADMASHRILSEALAALTPDIPVLSEESNAITFEQRRQWPRLWVVDPLDGTREFIKRNDEFTINVALVEHQQATLGVIAVPVEQTAYVGLAESKQAFKFDGHRQSQIIQTRRPCPGKPIVLGSRSHGNPVNEAYFKQLQQSFGQIDRIGAGSALKFCKVAEGSADFYPRFGPTSEWDTAAGHALVEAAGGRVWLADGRALRYNARSSLLNRSFLVAGDASIDWPMPPPTAG